MRDREARSRGASERREREARARGASERREREARARGASERREQETLRAILSHLANSFTFSERERVHDVLTLA
jgi:hypothetical protein